jgi:hypothetical protein
LGPRARRRRIRRQKESFGGSAVAPAYKLRDFKKLKIAANLGLALDPSEGERVLLKEYVEKSKEQKDTRLDRDSIQQMREPGDDCDVLHISLNNCLFTKLNILHYAATTGDITLMEEVVALGAALDFPIGDANTPDIPAPPGSTALLLACAMLAKCGDMERRDPNLRRGMPAEVFNNFRLLVSYYKLKRAAASVLKVTAAMTPAALNTGDCICPPPKDLMKMIEFANALFVWSILVPTVKSNSKSPLRVETFR